MDWCVLDAQSAQVSRIERVQPLQELLENLVLADVNGILMRVGTQRGA